MADYENDRLLSEKQIIKLAYQRFGLGAIKVKELLRDIPAASALTVNIPGEDKEKHDGF